MWWGNWEKHKHDIVEYRKQEAQLSLGQPTILVVSDLQGHPKSMFCMSFESQ